MTIRPHSTYVIVDGLRFVQIKEHTKYKKYIMSCTINFKLGYWKKIIQWNEYDMKSTKMTAGDY